MQELTDLPEKLKLPPNVALSAISMPVIRKSLNELRSSNTQLQLALQGMSVKRQAEFAAGRVCAAWSLIKMGVEPSFPLPVNDRLPVWPSKTLGSISHCEGVAVAVVTMRSTYCVLGIDVESMVDPAIVLDIQDSVCLCEELSHLEEYISCRSKALIMLFSAKEALYKALYPRVKRFMGFHAAEFCGFESESLVLRLTQNWGEQWLTGRKIKVHYAWHGKEVFSIVCI